MVDRLHFDCRGYCHGDKELNEEMNVLGQRTLKDLTTDGLMLRLRL